ncbi:MAG TPA: hypothetical protein VFG19_01245 [Geobacteraceae bacterium]|nr:hypothetical protein [Geobacteraceae bacterium]
MFKVFAMVFLLGVGSFGLVLVKNTIVFFVNLVLDSIKMSKETGRIASPEVKETIYKEFFEKASWLPRRLGKLFCLRHPYAEKKYQQKYKLPAHRRAEKPLGSAGL